MSKKIGFAVGIIIIVLAIVVFMYPVELSTPRMTEIEYESVSAPDYESDKSYGGDAYTGMQQASAQAANNLISVYGIIEQNNEGIKTLNSNLQEQAKKEANNLKVAVETVKFCIAMAMLAFGLSVIAKYADAFTAPKAAATPAYTGYTPVAAPVTPVAPKIEEAKPEEG